MRHALLFAAVCVWALPGPTVHEIPEAEPAHVSLDLLALAGLAAVGIARSASSSPTPT
jgi:hypothetical protein